MTLQLKHKCIIAASVMLVLGTTALVVYYQHVGESNLRAESCEYLFGESNLSAESYEYLFGESNLSAEDYEYLCPDAFTLPLDESVAVTTIVNPDGSPITYGQLLGAVQLRARDEGYLSSSVSCFTPAVYFSQEMEEQQRRITEMGILARWSRDDSIDCYYGSIDSSISRPSRMTQFKIDVLQLDLLRERDEFDAFLLEAFYVDSVVTVRFDETPLVTYRGVWFNRVPPAYESFIGRLDAGTNVRITCGFGGLAPNPSGSTPFGFMLISTNVEMPLREWNHVEVLDGEYAGHSGWIVNFLLKPTFD